MIELYCPLSFFTAILFGLKLNLREFLKPSTPKSALRLPIVWGLLYANDTFVQIAAMSPLGDLRTDSPPHTCRVLPP